MVPPWRQAGRLAWAGWRVWLCTAILWLGPVTSLSPARADADAAGVTWLTRPLPSGPEAQVPHASPAPHLTIRRVTRDSALVTLYFSVLDGNGEPISGLKGTDILLMVDGLENTPASFGVMAEEQAEHLTVVLALGFSDRANHAELALNAFSSAFVTELEESKTDLCALLTFRGRIAVPRLFSADPLLLKQALSRIHFSGEGLQLNAAIAAARTLIYQNDTRGYGAVVLALDEADSLDHITEGPAQDTRLSGGPAFYTLGVGWPSGARVESIRDLSWRTGGEAYHVPDDSLPLRSAVGRIVRLLQEQYVLRVAAPLASRIRLEWSEAGHTASDSVTLATTPSTSGPAGGADTQRPGMVRIILLAGVALVALIIALHLRNRA